MKPLTIPLRCACGAVQGVAGPLTRAFNRRFVCSCADCQAFAIFLGTPEKMLDEFGGSEIVPIHPARIRFSAGVEYLGCVRLSDDGMRRWYTLCCKTPVANTHPRNRLPFAGVHRSILSFSGDEI